MTQEVCALFSVRQKRSADRPDCGRAVKRLGEARAGGWREHPGELSRLSDAELLDGIRRSSQRYFSELYGRYFQRIYNFAYARVRNHADAEEIVQETFIAVFRSIDSYGGQSSLLAWTYGITRNTVNSHLRRVRNEGLRREAVDPEVFHPKASFATFTPEEQLHMARYADAIRSKLESVAPWQAEVFVMRHLENLSIREISERTERSSDAIRSSLYRIKRLMCEAAGDGAAGRLP